VAGYLLKKEIEFLGGALAAPKHPFTAVIGGAKVSGKIDVIENLIGVVDQFIIGGGMAFTFLKAQGGEIGKSLLEDDKISLASEILAKAQAAGSPILLPTDILCGEKLEADTPTSVHPAKEIPSNLAGFDIGPDSIKTFCEALKKSAMVVWNGPMGVFEVSPFHTGTETLARTLGSLTDAITIVGGGDSIAAVEQFGLHDQMTHVSTGGGASLEMMEGKILPGITALDDKE
jgi:phosphoglycerate kinase